MASYFLLYTQEKVTKEKRTPMMPYPVGSLVVPLFLYGPHSTRYPYRVSAHFAFLAKCPKTASLLGKA